MIMQLDHLDGYFDYAAATPVDPGVSKAMQPYISELFYNPSADYEPARRARKALDEARSKIAMILGSKSSEIIFSAGGSEANNLAIHGVMRQYTKANLIISAIEHDSVTAPAQNYDWRVAAVTPAGIVDLQALEKMIDDKTVLVSVMQANNEIGTVQPIRKIAQLLRQVRANRQKTGNSLPIFLHSDAAQAGNYLDMHVHDLGVDLFSINGGKLYGPKQTGVLFVSSHVQLKPLIEGGGQERNLRSGTENIASAVGLAEALEIAQNMRSQEAKRLHELQISFIKQLQAAIPSVVINGSLKSRLPNNLHITIPGQDNERLLILLDQQGIYAAAGSACSASKEAPSHVLQALGMSKDDIQASLRFSMGRFTSDSSVKRAVSLLASKLA
jgi:cysteine desulfurase